MKQFFSEKNIVRLFITWICILSVLYATLSIVRHNHFQSGGFDLGLYDQEIWQYSRFLWPYNSVKERFILGDHLTLTLPLVAPLLWIWNDVRILLVLQAVAISVSAYAVYLLIRARKFSPFVALCISFIYSLFYGIQYGIFFDFHPVLLATSIIPWMLYFLETKRQKLFITALALLILTQENMGLALTSLGFIYIWKKPYRGISVAFIIGGVTVSLFAAKIVASLSPVGFQYTPHVTLNPVSFIQQLFDAAEKQQVWLYSLSTFSFLPLLSPGALVAVVFDLAQYFTTGPDFARMWSPFMHHRAILAPYLLLGSLDAFAFFQKKKMNLQLIATLLVASALFQQFVFHYPLNKLTKSAFWQHESWMTDNEQMIRTIPDSMRLTTQQSLIPHLTHRKEIYLFWPRVHDIDSKPCGQVSCWWIDFNDRSEFLLVDLHPNQWITQLLETNEHVQMALDNMEKLQKITLVRKINTISLYKVNK